MNIKLRLFQAVYGFTKMVTHLDGRNILVKFDKMIKNMNTLKINDTEYDMSSPSGLEFRNQYITSFGDEVLPKISVNWNHIEGFYLNLNSDIDKEFAVKIFDRDNTLLYQTMLKGGMYCRLSRRYYNGIRYEIHYNSTIIAQETINRFVATRTIIGSGGVSKSGGLTEFDQVIADINRSMVERCEEVIVLVDPSKGGVTAHYRVAGIDIVDEFVTSNDGRETLQRQLGTAATILTPNG